MGSEAENDGAVLTNRNERRWRRRWKHRGDVHRDLGERSCDERELRVLRKIRAVVARDQALGVRDVEPVIVGAIGRVERRLEAIGGVPRIVAEHEGVVP